MFSMKQPEKQQGMWNSATYVPELSKDESDDYITNKNDLKECKDFFGY